MAPDPLVAVIVVNWNGKAMTRDCLRSLEQVAYRNRSVIVVDNGSTDGSVDALTHEFPGVTFLPLPENRRFAGGSNVGIRHALSAGAEMVVLLNNDTTVDPAFLTYMVECQRSDPRCAMVAPKIYYFREPERIWFAGGRVSFWTGTLSHVGIRQQDLGQYDTSRPIAYATGCCLLATRDLCEKVGLLDEAYRMYAEDADWSLRARRSGYCIVFEPRARVWHKISVSSGGHLSWYKLRHKEWSNMRFMARHASWYHWLTFPWLHLLVNAWAALGYLFSSRR